MFEAVLYLLVTGCQWRALPTTFPPWQTVYWHWSRWVSSGIFEKILRRLRRGERRRGGRKADPSALIIDSQSVKASSSATQAVGYDAGKKINGRKRHLLVDSQGNLIDVVVHAANIQDRDGAKLIIKRLAHAMTRVRLIWADGGYRGKLLTWVREVRTQRKITMRIVEKEPGAKSCAVSKLWGVPVSKLWGGPGDHPLMGLPVVA